MAKLIQSELQHRGGFVPLMHKFPVDEVFTRGYSIPWGSRDHQLRAAISSGKLSLDQEPSSTQQQHAAQLD